MQTKSQYCKTKSQIKQKEYSGMTHHGFIFTGTTPIGNIRICSSTMVVGITTTYAISTYHHYSRYRYFWTITVLIWKKACINLFITYFNIELKRTKLFLSCNCVILSTNNGGQINYGVIRSCT
jgi:hypothetical protein